MVPTKQPKFPIARRPEVLDYKPSQGRDVPVTVRIPQPMLSDIESLVKTRPIKIPRHTWLMEAIYEKWKKETGRQGR
jgi:hypothetical protein